MKDDHCEDRQSSKQSNTRHMSSKHTSCLCSMGEQQIIRRGRQYFEQGALSRDIFLRYAAIIPKPSPATRKKSFATATAVELEQSVAGCPAVPASYRSMRNLAVDSVVETNGWSALPGWGVHG